VRILPSAPYLCVKQMPSRNLDDLLPQVKEKALQLDEDCREENIILLFTATYRTPEEQDELYSHGRTKPGPIVTNSKAWQSWHNVKRAFDVVPKDVDGNIWWAAPERIWQKIGLIGKACGLEWGGDFKSLKDRPHFELKEGLTLAEAREQLENPKDSQADGVKA
jgi:peptidoglycan L-alanyl-D-glutamate endopeptidase CwlK